MKCQINFVFRCCFFSSVGRKLTVFSLLLQLVVRLPCLPSIFINIYFFRLLETFWLSGCVCYLAASHWIHIFYDEIQFLWLYLALAVKWLSICGAVRSSFQFCCRFQFHLSLSLSHHMKKKQLWVECEWNNLRSKTVLTSFSTRQRYSVTTNAHNYKVNECHGILFTHFLFRFRPHFPFSRRRRRRTAIFPKIFRRACGTTPASHSLKGFRHSKSKIHKLISPFSCCCCRSVGKIQILYKLDSN